MQDLDAVLKQHAAQSDIDADVARAVNGLARAAAAISKLIRTPDKAANLGAIKGSANADGDDQKALDVLADDEITAQLHTAGVAIYLSEEQDTPIPLHADGTLIVASDPLDGSSNIDTNVSIGTIFSIMPAAGGSLQCGRNQLAAGFFVYGPQTTLLLTLGDGVLAFQMDDDGFFCDMGWQVAMPADTQEFGINTSNQRHWHAPVKAYIDACLDGRDGELKRNYNMRWVGSLVADAWRIFRRGGVFLYPADCRDGYSQGRLRLVYEANPVAMLVEQAGGKATNGTDSILDIQPQDLHERVAFIFGSMNEVDVIIGYHS
ncbi:class 1 fructose-bisphosphatase [Candidatus Puniceispirillum marinum]|uniref:Fructose-1,6-bisphosphatase class 1 n=1 Tax=Puniceispirillum marinum (strain IMCC1322) TaxID=488538 RepID=D5BTQ9_PUNMI|nr:class 1 fructose-bisphosphatase [Candidatus Puniceispirillum marinum]ADE39656.1 fructose-1,6-bisphosphatase [Candidatus Puniceispirillum marinum IMCC1322]